MPLANTSARYGSVAMTLHWLIAGALILNVCLGLYMSEILPDGDPSRLAILQLHKSVGLTVLALSVARLGWRLRNPVPPLPASMPAWLRIWARATHYLLYFLIIAIPLSGWLLASSSRAGTSTFYFGLFHWPKSSVFGNSSTGPEAYPAPRLRCHACMSRPLDDGACSDPHRRRDLPSAARRRRSAADAAGHKSCEPELNLAIATAPVAAFDECCG